MLFRRACAALLLTALVATAGAQMPYTTKPLRPEKFAQLDGLLPTPTEVRSASGAPGHHYWQQRADYVIDVELDDSTQSIKGRAQISYTNHSPDALTYLWLQLDPNIFSHESDTRSTAPGPRAAPGRGISENKMPYRNLEALLLEESYTSDLQVSSVTDQAGAALPYRVVKTMMRIDLPRALAPSDRISFSVAWNYRINDAKLIPMRGGFEYFPKDGNYLYEIAQWFPRMAAYTDLTGWQHKAYLGRSEFTLEFGDYEVRITAPADHVVAATGVLQNPEAVLTATQRDRLKEALTANKPVFIITPDEARENQKDGAAKTKAAASAAKKTWIFKAENVRDFAFASSRKFIWDAWGAPEHTWPVTHPSIDGSSSTSASAPTPPSKAAASSPRQPVLAMSFYPVEGEPLWSHYSTQAIVHTLDVYSRHTFPFPYPVAQSINGPIGGMEYPMICFNGPRPEDDRTYPARTKYGLISVVIHEVGHNYFPMIVNTDERLWTWMDEGMNSFLQYLAEQAWEKDYPSRRGEPRDMIAYMTGPDQEPIMTSGEEVTQVGPNAYGKPATALNVLRETILGREAFDHAFKTYAQRWQFKRPYPADFFRTMEDASGVDLDWFWRGWFYSTDHVEISLDAVRAYTLDTKDPAIENARREKQKKERPQTLSAQRNASLPKRVDRYPELKDFYNSYDEATVLPSEKKKFDELVKSLTKEEIDPALLKTVRQFYVLDFTNHGGLVMPLILKLEYTDGTSEERRIPAEIWRLNNQRVSKLILTPKELKSVTLDPHEETADADVENNFWPRRPIKSRFQLYKDEEPKNPMKELHEAEKKKSEGEKGSDDEKR